jgi:uncharacterized protein YPO0396
VTGATTKEIPKPAKAAKDSNSSSSTSISAEFKLAKQRELAESKEKTANLNKLLLAMKKAFDLPKLDKEIKELKKKRNEKTDKQERSELLDLIRTKKKARWKEFMEVEEISRQLKEERARGYFLRQISVHRSSLYLVALLNF